MVIEIKLCKCGCGNLVPNGRTYLRGHNRKGEVGFFLGKHHTEQARIKISLSHKGQIPWNKGGHQTEKAKEILREKAKTQWQTARINGNPIGMTGRRHSEETRAKLVQAHIGKHPTKEQNIKNSNAQKGELNHFYGKHHTKESLLKMSKVHSGVHLTEEQKSKISKANRGRVISEEQRIKDVKAHTGKYHTGQTKIKLRQIVLKQWQDIEYRKKHIGENSGRWLGGKSFEPYGSDFNKQLKELIRIRDGYVCQLCGVPEIEICRKLGIHHIDYTKINNMPNNLISLCPVCHTKINCNREYWTDYFRNLLNQRQISPKPFLKKQKPSILGMRI